MRTLRKYVAYQHFYLSKWWAEVASASLPAAAAMYVYNLQSTVPANVGWLLVPDMPW